MKVEIEALPEEKITTSLKPIDREDATLEAEKGEIVHDPNSLTLHKVLGKRHSQGGTPLDLPEGNFIFSDYNKLAIKPKERELMQFRTLGTKKLTPAKLLEKEIDIKHHNKMLNILREDEGDEFTKNSASLMLSKNLQVIGKTAFLQESKKRFPDGIPSFSKGSAPIFSNEISNEMNQAKQYKTGGRLLPKFQSTGLVSGLNRYETYDRPSNIRFRDPGYGTLGLLNNYFTSVRSLPGNNSYYSNILNSSNPYRNLYNLRSDLTQGRYKPFVIDAFNQNAFNLNHNLAESLGYGKIKPTDDQILNNFIDSKGNNESIWGQDRVQAYQQTFNSREDRDKEVETKGFSQVPGNLNYFRRIDPLTGIYTGAILNYKIPKEQPISARVNTPLSITPNPIKGLKPSIYTPSISPSASTETDLPLQRTDYNVGLTGWEKLNAAYPFFKAATVKTLWPLRQHQESLISNPEYASARPYLNRIDQSYFNTAQLARINPNASQSIQQLQGDRIDQSNQAIANVEEQNRQTGSQFRTNIANVLNQDASANRQHDLSYYDRAQTSIQNRDDMKDYLFNQGLTNLNDMIAQNQSFNYLLNSQPQIGTNEWIDRYGRPTNDRSKAVARRARTITEFIPGFFGNRLYNPTTFNVKDLLSYNTGLSGSNYNFIQNEIDRLDKLREQASPEERKGLDYRIGRLYSSLFRGNS